MKEAKREMVIMALASFMVAVAIVSAFYWGRLIGCL